MIKEVYKNIYQIIFPLSGNPLKSINIFLIKTRDMNLIIDTGFNNEENRKNMDDLISYFKLDLNKTKLFLTHLHSDHVGLAKYLEDKNISEIFLSKVDGDILKSGYSLEGKQWKNILANAKRQGLLKEDIDIRYHPGFKNRPHEPFKFTSLKTCDKLKIGEFDFTLIDEAGHTPGMVGLYDKDKKILFCGDHILGKITPNITYWGDEYGDSLGIYLKNIEKLKDLDIKYLFSSHRFLVENPRERIDQLIDHHSKRLDDCIMILEKLGEADTRDICKRMNWDIRAKNWDDFPSSQKWFAVGEASAHLKHLLALGKINERVGNDGINYYSIKKDKC